MNLFLIIIGGAIAVALPSAFYLQKRGYSFAASFVKVFLAAAGVIGLIASLFLE